MKTHNKREQYVTSNHSADSEFKDFIKFYKDYSNEPLSLLVNDTTYHQITH